MGFPCASSAPTFVSSIFPLEETRVSWPPPLPPALTAWVHIPVALWPSLARESPWVSQGHNASSWSCSEVRCVARRDSWRSVCAQQAFALGLTTLVGCQGLYTTIFPHGCLRAKGRLPAWIPQRWAANAPGATVISPHAFPLPSPPARRCEYVLPDHRTLLSIRGGQEPSLLVFPPRLPL